MTSGSLGVSTPLGCKAALKIPKAADGGCDRLQWCSTLQFLGKLYMLLLGITNSSEMLLWTVSKGIRASTDEQTMFVGDKLPEDDELCCWP